MPKQLVSIKKEAKFNIVTFVALVPDEEDLNGDIISVDEIQLTAIEFMLNIQSKDINVDHDDDQKIEKFNFVESYIAPIDMEINDDAIIPKWSWILWIQFDDYTYEKVLSGDYVWISIQGKGVLEEIEKKLKYIEKLKQIKKWYE